MVKTNLAVVDIVIPVHGQFDLLLKCLNALPDAFKEIDYKVIMVDDASPENLEIFLTGKPDAPGHMKPNYRVVRNTERAGFPAACNKGTAIGMAPFVMFLNSDCILFENCGTILLEAFKDGSVGIASPMLLFPPDSTIPNRPANKVQHAGIMFDVFGSPLHAFLGWNPEHPKVNQRRDMQAVTGACFMITREVIKAVSTVLHRYDRNHKFGLFQEDYGMGTYEDIEACLTVRALGKKIVFIPEARGYHYTGASAIASNTPFPLQRNEMIFKARWQGSIAWDEHIFV